MNELLIEGLSAMLIGMGRVLSFLCLMIVSMFIMSKVVLWLNKIFPEAIEEVKTTAKKVSTATEDAIAVAIAAIMAKRS